MAETPKQPVAIRIVRPYESENQFLENEIDTIGKTSVLLVGAHARPVGVVLRFEVTLSTGTTVLRGEGRVLGHKDKAFRGQQGLALRFTRLDPKSKALVDRAAAIREARAHGEAAPSSQPLPPPASSQPHVPETDDQPTDVNRAGPQDMPPQEAPPDVPPPSARLAAPAPPPRSLPRPPTGSKAFAPVPPPSSPQLTPPPVPVAAAHAPPPVPAPHAQTASIATVLTAPTPSPGPAAARKASTKPAFPAPPAAAVAAATSFRTIAEALPANKGELLERLRTRAKSLPQERVAEILAKRPSS